MGATRRYRLDAVSDGLLVHGLPVWSNVGFERAVGLRALSLRPLGLCQRSLVLGAGPYECRAGLFARTRRVGSVRPEPDRLGAAWSRRHVRAALLLQQQLGSVLLDSRQSVPARCESQRAW